MDVHDKKGLLEIINSKWENSVRCQNFQDEERFFQIIKPILKGNFFSHQGMKALESILITLAPKLEYYFKRLRPLLVNN